MTDAIIPPDPKAPPSPPKDGRPPEVRRWAENLLEALRMLTDDEKSER